MRSEIERAALLDPRDPVAQARALAESMRAGLCATSGQRMVYEAFGRRCLGIRLDVPRVDIKNCDASPAIFGLEAVARTSLREPSTTRSAIRRREYYPGGYFDEPVIYDLYGCGSPDPSFPFAMPRMVDVVESPPHDYRIVEHRRMPSERGLTLLEVGASGMGLTSLVLDVGASDETLDAVMAAPGVADWLVVARLRVGKPRQIAIRADRGLGESKHSMPVGIVVFPSHANAFRRRESGLAIGGLDASIEHGNCVWSYVGGAWSSPCDPHRALAIWRALSIRGLRAWVVDRRRMASQIGGRLTYDPVHRQFLRCAITLV